GGSNIYNSANITMTGEAANNYFGYSASSAGDVNGDGFADIIIGAYGYNSNKGKSYLFLSSAIATKPIITSVKDVANDQGGALTLTFNRTAYDVKGQTKYLSNYEVLRSLTPVNSGYAWEKIASITPLKEPRYSYTAETVFDSMTNQSGTLYFKIIARTQNDNEYYVSNIMSGHSVDNLAPASVSLFRGTVSGGQILLNWKANTEEDLSGYYLYRSTDATINPDITTPLIVVQDTSYADRNPLPGSSYYFIRAKDIHGNYSQLRSSSNNPLPVELSMFEAKVKGTTIELKWRTATEISLLKFEIEKTNKPGIEWQLIGEENAHGNSNSPKEYSFTDNHLTVGSYLYRLKMINSDGTFKYSESIEVDVKQPVEFALNQNYPNPFNPVTKIKYQIPDRGSFVTLKVYDILGNEVATLVNEEKEPGYYEVEFNSKNLSSGTYFYRLSAGKFVQMKKMLLLK
ncbi:MAG: T9SS type A sorting domain-containing protein, partial [Ignavibacteria bacterium]|nr:T9SS type A sorting domain-containing protein [Ignavibacteria bacterium]